jgi:hypothetical protein
MLEVCPILAVGVYFLSCDLGNSKTSPFFKCSKQYDRYWKTLDRLFEGQKVALEMDARGIPPEDVGTHSTHKSCITYVCSGSTPGPNFHPVAIQAGWSMPSVQSTYIKYDQAGDQHVGRTVCGLPPDKPEFGISPPYFNGSRDLVTTSVRECFPNLCPSTMRIDEICLASLVYLAGWMKE